MADKFKINEAMNSLNSLKDRFRFFLFRHKKKVKKTSGWGWGGISILLFPENATAPIRKLRINYFLIVFVILFLLTPPLVNTFLWLQTTLTKDEKQSSEIISRQRLLQTFMGLSIQKKGYIETVQKQIERFHDHFSTEKNYDLIKRLEENNQGTTMYEVSNHFLFKKEKHRSRYPLEILSENKERMKYIVNQEMPYVLEPIYHRMSIYNLTPRGWGLLGGVGHVTSKYGNRQNPTGTGVEFHTGVDFASAEGTPIVSIASGIVVRAIRDSYSGYGKFVHIHHGLGYSSLYAHCQNLAVQEGQYVEKGQIIAYVGHTGRTTGAHLHLTVLYGYGRPVDPLPYVELK